ncbi:MAG: paraquat-inducible protein A [Pseudomonadota bacterium]
MTAPRAPDLNALIACPRCDLLHHVRPQSNNQIARCSRCHVTLITTRQDAIPRVTALALTVLILMVAAIFFPFLNLKTGGLSNSASLFDAATAFQSGILIPLSGAVAALIILLPTLRVSAILYALTPLMLGRKPARHAAFAFRLAEKLKPWAMAEIFIIGVAVALVKVTGLAQVTPGPAFWAFCALVVIIVLKDTAMCKWSIWSALR